MSDRTKELIIKTLIVIGMISLALVFPIPIFYCWFVSEKVFNLLFYTSLVIFFISGSFLTILLPIFGIKQPPVKAERIMIKYKDFEELLLHLKKSLSQHNYTQVANLNLNSQNNMFVYIHNKTDCFVIFQTEEFDDENLNICNDRLTDILTEIYGTKRITENINVILLVCVKRVNTQFQKLVNTNMTQGFKNGRLITGISFGSKTLYIAKQKGGFAIKKYKKLKNEFLNLFEF